MTDPRPGPGPNGSESGPADALGRRQDPPEDPAPQPVRIARWLWIAATLVGLVRSFVQLSDRRSLTAELAAQMPQWSQEQVDSAVNGTIMSVLLLSGAIVALYWALAARLLQGRNWARVVVAFVAGLRSLSTAFVVVALAAYGAETLGRMSGVPLGPTEIAFSLVTAVLDVAVLVLLFLPESQRHFRAGRSGSSAGA